MFGVLDVKWSCRLPRTFFVVTDIMGHASQKGASSGWVGAPTPTHSLPLHPAILSLTRWDGVLPTDMRIEGMQSANQLSILASRDSSICPSLLSASYFLFIHKFTNSLQHFVSLWCLCWSLLMSPTARLHRILFKTRKDVMQTDDMRGNRGINSRK